MTYIDGSENNTVVALPCCGLGNRFHQITLSVLYAAEHGGRARVVWHQDAEVGGSYRDLFEGHPSFDVVDTPPESERYFGAESPSCISEGHCSQWHIAAGAVPTCANASSAYYDVLAAAGLPLADRGRPPRHAVLRGCGTMRIPEAYAQLCAQFLKGVRIRGHLADIVAAALPPRHSFIGVHLRAPDSAEAAEAEVAMPRRQLSQGRTHCHPVALFAQHVAMEAASNQQLSSVYVAASAPSYVDEFARALMQRDPSLPRRLRILTFADVTAHSQQHQRTHNKQSGARAGELATHSGVRDSLGGMQAAVVDLWALASAYKLLRSGQSTFGQLAAAIHTRPEEVVVRDTNESGCPAFAAMYPNQLPAFCSPHHGKSRLKSCGCRATP